MKKLLLFLFFFFLYMTNFKYLSPLTFNTVDRIYGTDTENYISVFIGEPKIGSILWKIKEGGDLVVKHPGFAMLIALLLSLSGGISQSSMETILSFLYPLFSALSVVSIYLLLDSFIKEKRTTFLFAAFYGFSFWTLVSAAIPSYYMIATLVAMLYWLLFTKLGRSNTAITILITIFPGLASLFNPPLMLLVIPTVFAFIKLFGNKGIILSFLVILINPVIWIGTLIVLSPKAFAIMYSLTHNVLNPFSPQLFLNVILSFIFYSIINPLGSLSDCITPLHFLSYLNSPWRSVLLVGYIFFLSIVVKRIFGVRSLWINALSLWSMSTIGFHVFYNPREAMTYSFQTVFPLVMIGAWYFKEEKMKYKYIFLRLFILIMAGNNLGALYNTVLHFGE